MSWSVRVLLMTAMLAVCHRGSSEEEEVYIRVSEVMAEIPDGIDFDQLTPIQGLTDRNDIFGACVLSDREFQVLIRTIDQRRGTNLVSLPGITVALREEAKVEYQGVRWTVKPEAKNEGRMIDLEIRLSVDGEEASEFRIVIPDGHNLMCWRGAFGKSQRCSFIKASLMKPTDSPLEEKKIPYLKHFVQEGEILEDVAEFYGIETDDIVAFNGRISDPLESGLYLLIPVRKPKWDMPFTIPESRPK